MIKLSQDVILLLKTFEKSTTILAKILVRIKSTLFLLTRLLIPVSIATSARLTSNLRATLDNLAITLNNLT